MAFSQFFLFRSDKKQQSVFDSLLAQKLNLSTQGEKISLIKTYSRMLSSMQFFLLLLLTILVGFPLLNLLQYKFFTTVFLILFVLLFLWGSLYISTFRISKYLKNLN
jgi:hypothetical protein